MWKLVSAEAIWTECPLNWLTFTKETHVSNVQQQMLTLHSLYNLSSDPTDSKKTLAAFPQQICIKLFAILSKC